VGALARGYRRAAVLLALAVTLVAAPEALPGLTVPGGGMHDAGSMGAMP